MTTMGVRVLCVEAPSEHPTPSDSSSDPDPRTKTTKMASSSKGFCAGELDHPEVLSRERLLEILSDRCLPVSEIEHQEKHELVSLFYRFVSPLPQRTRQLKRTTRQPVCATNDGTAGSKRRFVFLVQIGLSFAPKQCHFATDR